MTSSFLIWVSPLGFIKQLSPVTKKTRLNATLGSALVQTKQLAINLILA